MGIFATANWAAGYAMSCLLIVSAVVLAISVVGIILGARLLRSTSPAGRRCGRGLLLLVACLLAICCYVARPQAVRLQNGTHPLGIYPSNKIQEGMSREDVEAILGPPYQRDEYNDRETWSYLVDPHGERFFFVDFGPDGRATSTYGD